VGASLPGQRVCGLLPAIAASAAVQLADDALAADVPDAVAARTEHAGEIIGAPISVGQK